MFKSPQHVPLRQALAVALSATLISANSIGQNEIEEVIVMGSKLDQSLMETATSVTVIDRNTIEQAGINSLRDIDELSPNVSISQIGQIGGSYISIRGIESNPFIVNRAAVYIDGIPYREPGIIKIKNAEQIEVLRGPQSTLYGANADAGVIVIRTRTPEQEFNAELYTGMEFFAGRHSNTLGGFFSSALSEQLSANLSIDYEFGDSYVRNIASSIAKQGEIKDLNLSSIIRYQTDDNSELNIALLYNRLRAPGLYEQEFPALNYQDYNQRYAPLNNAGKTVNKFEIANDSPKNTEQDEWGIGLSYSHELAGMSLDLVAAYRNIEDSSMGTDLDLTATPVTAGGGRGEREFWNIEARLASDNGDDEINWMVGVAYYQQERSRALSTLVGPGSLGDYNYAPDQTTNSDDSSIFAQLLLPLTPKLSLNTGLRYEKSEADIQQQAGVLSLGPGFDFNFPAINKSTSHDIWLPKVSLSYQLDIDGQIYAAISKGYLPGGYNLVAADKGDEIDRQFGPYDSEELWSYEIGSKLRLLDGDLFLSGALFFIDASSWQEVNLLTTADGRVLSTSLISSNAAIESRGFELEAIYQASDKLELRMGLGYVDSEYKTYDFSSSQNFAGNKVKLIPEYDVSLAASYQLNQQWQLRGEFHGMGETPLNADNTVSRKSLGLWDFSLDYQGDHWKLRAFIENAGNKRYAAGQAYQNFLLGDDGVFYAPLAQPRTAGFEFSYQLR